MENSYDPAYFGSLCVRSGLVGLHLDALDCVNQQDSYLKLLPSCPNPYLKEFYIFNSVLHKWEKRLKVKGHAEGKVQRLKFSNGPGGLMPIYHINYRIPSKVKCLLILCWDFI